MSISAHAYMHMVCMHTWCSKMFSSTNGTFCWLCQAEYISGGRCLNPEHVSTLVVFVKMELCKSALFMCFLSFQWHFSVSVVMFFIVLYFSSAKLAFLFFSCLLFLRLFCLSMFWIVCCDFVAAKTTVRSRRSQRVDELRKSDQKRYAQLLKLTPLTTLPRQISAHACAAAHSMSISSLYPCASAHFTRSHVLSKS